MAAKQKIDGVIEAVHYAPDGDVALVRLYPRLLTTYADRVLVTRAALLEQIKAGKHFVTGQRKPSWGATFEPGSEIMLDQSNNRDVITCGQPGTDHDVLQGVPRF